MSVTKYLDELGCKHFFDTFRLEEDSPFADLVIAMTDLSKELCDEQDAKIVLCEFPAGNKTRKNCIVHFHRGRGLRTTRDRGD